VQTRKIITPFWATPKKRNKQSGASGERSEADVNEQKAHTGISIIKVEQRRFHYSNLNLI
jgi:hypothetical protein